MACVGEDLLTATEGGAAVSRHEKLPPVKLFTSCFTCFVFPPPLVLQLLGSLMQINCRYPLFRINQHVDDSDRSQKSKERETTGGEVLLEQL